MPKLKLMTKPNDGKYVEQPYLYTSPVRVQNGMTCKILTKLHIHHFITPKFYSSMSSQEKRNYASLRSHARLLITTLLTATPLETNYISINRKLI